MLFYALLHLGEQLGIRRGAFILVAHVDVHQGRAGLEGLVRGFDLLGGGHRDGGVVFFLRHGAGDRDGDDDGLAHARHYSRPVNGISPSGK